jgi:type I restriction enzyme S subunit
MIKLINETPQVRFKEFTDKLRNGALSDFGSFYYGKSAPKWSLSDDAITPCVRYGELYSSFSGEVDEIKSYTNIPKEKLKFSKGGEVLIPRVGENPLHFSKASYLPFKGVAIGEMISVYNTGEGGQFITQYIRARLKKSFAQVVEGGNVSNLYFRYLEPIHISIPSLSEQQKIAGFLSAVDKNISLLKEKHALLQQYKKGAIQKLFSQEICFKDKNGNNFPSWEEDRLDSFVVKASDPVEVDPNSTYREIGVRSHAKGVFHKKEIKGHELGNKRVFWIHPNAFIVNIVFAWEHAVALTSESEKGFIASHRFPMFVPKADRVDLRYFTIFFRSKKGKYLLGLASPGGAGRNKTLGQSNFAELKLTFPCLEEQTRIADFYEALDNKAKLVAQKIEYTQIFKKGLLQQLFV